MFGEKKEPAVGRPILFCPSVGQEVVMRWMWMGLMAGFMAACGQEGLEITEPQGEEMMEIDISQSSLRSAWPNVSTKGCTAPPTA